VRETAPCDPDGVSITTVQFELVDAERPPTTPGNAVSQLRADLPCDMQEPTAARIDITGDALTPMSSARAP
jgi:HAE1 family hydrophobic/amphiphilic exporter-1